MAILDDLRDLYDNLWDASFTYQGEHCGIFPNSINDIPVYIGEREFRANSFDSLITLDIDGRLLQDILTEATDIQYY